MDTNAGAILPWTSALQQRDFTNTLDAKKSNLFQQGMAVQERLLAALHDPQCPFSETFRKAGLDACQDFQALWKHLPTYLVLLREGNWLGALQALYELQLPGLASFEHLEEGTDCDDSVRVHNLWNGEFHGRSLQALKQMLHTYEHQWSKSPQHFYSKSLVMFQSSGTGKSRLADEIGKENFQFSFVFRKQGETGYPPADAEIISYFDNSSDSKYPADTKVASFLGALGMIGLRWYGEQCIQNSYISAPELARKWNSLMAPIISNSGDRSKYAKLSRSKFRTDFCLQLKQEAEKLCYTLSTMHQVCFVTLLIC
ncbi:hypothetical protein BDZ91DRAFT_523185 [Kalaharituber pfeilii]|nr:hypothetical protein BDZ91DRAFT_523185 [Kalaharituber pfeilii]